MKKHFTKGKRWLIGSKLTGKEENQTKLGLKIGRAPKGSYGKANISKKQLLVQKGTCFALVAKTVRVARQVGMHT